MQFTLKEMGTAIVISISITAGGTWYACQERISFLKEKLSTYKTFANIDLPNLSSNLSTASSKLSTQLKTLENIEKLQEANKTLDQSNSQLQNSVLELRKENKSLQEKIDSLFSFTEEFSVNTQSSHQFLERKFSVGVTRVYFESAEINFENKIYNIDAGNRLLFEYKEQNCKLTVTSINYINSSVSFNVTCEKKAAT